MTISTTTSTRVSYTGNGSTTDFAVNYPIFKDGATTHFLKVLKKTVADGTVVELVENSDYTVTQSGGDPSTGTVTISPALTSAYKIYILSALPALQELDLVNGTNVDVTRLEYQFDYLTMYNQQQLEVNTRAIILPETSDETSIDFPSFDGSVEGDIPTVNAAGDGYVYKSVDELVNISAFAINGLTEDTSPSGANDFVPTYDTSAAGQKKVKLDNLPVNITGKTELTSVDSSNDMLLIYDNSAAEVKKVKVENVSSAPDGSILGTKTASSTTILATMTIRTWTDVPDLSLVYTPKKVGTKILLIGSVFLSLGTPNTGLTRMTVNGKPIPNKQEVQLASTLETTPVIETSAAFESSGDYCFNIFKEYEVTSLDELTFKIQVMNTSSTNTHVKINSSQNTTADKGTVPSTLSLMEINI